MKIQLHPEVTVENNIYKKSGITLKLLHATSRIQNALNSLVDGYDEQLLEAKLPYDGLIHFYYYLEELKKACFLIYRTTLLDLYPFNGGFVPKKFRLDQTFSLSRFSWCRVDEGKFVLETPLSATRAYLNNEIAPLVFALKTPMSIEQALLQFPSIDSKEIEESFCLLASAQMITSKEEPHLRQWEFHDLLFHTRSRCGRIDTPYGGTYRFKGKIDPPPFFKNYLSAQYIALNRPQNDLSVSFDEVLNKRKSIREHGSEPITIDELGQFLWRCARVETFDAQDQFSKRPYPGGGALYELEIYPLIYKCKGVEAGIYHYDPFEHQLGKLSGFDEQAEAFLIDARMGTIKKEYPQILLMITARFQRVSWKYQSMAYALILKNLGVLLQTMYLVATASNLAPCAVGIGNSDRFSDKMGTNYFEETTVGEFILGSR